MVGLLALLGIFAVLWWISKVLRRVSSGLAQASIVLADLAAYCGKKSVNNNHVLRQNIIAEKKLQHISGEVSNVSYNREVRKEIDKLIENLEP